jgi:hypothetical protein
VLTSKKESKVKEDSNRGESIEGSNEANASGEAGASPVRDQELKLQYKGLAADPVKVAEFVQRHRPSFAEPYALLWNLFAKEKNFPQVREITTERRRKIKTRAAEKSFDIIGILNKARASPGLKPHWFSFDWIIKNQSNYTKVLEGNYGAPKIEANGSHQQTPAVKPAGKSAGANQLLGMLHADLHAISGGAQGS